MDSQCPQESQGGASASPHTLTPSKPESAPRRISESAKAISLPHNVAEWEKNSRETLRVQLSQYQGRTIVDLRQWYLDKSGELRPSLKGLAVAIVHLPMLAAVLSDALAIARDASLLEGGEK